MVPSFGEYGLLWQGWHGIMALSVDEGSLQLVHIIADQKAENLELRARAGSGSRLYPLRLPSEHHGHACLQKVS